MPQRAFQKIYYSRFESTRDQKKNYFGLLFSRVGKGCHIRGECWFARQACYASGLSTTTLNGGSVSVSDAGRPWWESFSAVQPGKLPTLLPA